MPENANDVSIAAFSSVSRWWHVISDKCSIVRLYRVRWTRYREIRYYKKAKWKLRITQLTSDKVMNSLVLLSSTLCTQLFALLDARKYTELTSASISPQRRMIERLTGYRGGKEERERNGISWSVTFSYDNHIVCSKQSRRRVKSTRKKRRDLRVIVETTKNRSVIACNCPYACFIESTQPRLYRETYKKNTAGARKNGARCNIARNVAERWRDQSRLLVQLVSSRNEDRAFILRRECAAFAVRNNGRRYPGRIKIFLWTRRNSAGTDVQSWRDTSETKGEREREKKKKSKKGIVHDLQRNFSPVLHEWLSSSSFEWITRV